MSTFLLPASTAPREDDLSAADISFLQQHFETTNREVVVDGNAIDWEKIDEIEVVVAARDPGPTGWLIKRLYYGGMDRYHVGIYSGRYELVLPNLSLAAATYVVRTIAYYARNRIRYTGPDGLAATAEA